jgi:glycosyltransferase involved in cell wall biosynthesis
MKTPKVLHIDIENGWRGGQNQAIYLYETELQKGLDSHFICKVNTDFHKILKHKNLPHTALNYKNEVDIFSAIRISKIAKKYEYNIINCHSSHSLSLGLLSKYFYSKSKIIGVRRVDFKIKNNFLSKWKYNSDNLDALICVSDAIKNIMKNYIKNNNKLIVIHDGIDTQKYLGIDSSNLRKEYNLNDNIIVGTIAAFVGHKDYPTLLKTIKIISEIRNDITFIALGDGPLFNNIKKLAEDLHISDNIIFTGFKENVGEFLNLFDIFILTSNEEGLGSTLLDAMSVGLPIVATKAGGIPEIIKDKTNGILCDIQDASSLANAVIQLVDNVELRNLYGSNSKKIVQTFSIEKTAEKYFDLYQKLLA